MGSSLEPLPKRKGNHSLGPSDCPKSHNCMWPHFAFRCSVYLVAKEEESWSRATSPERCLQFYCRKCICHVSKLNIVRLYWTDSCWQYRLDSEHGNRGGYFILVCVLCLLATYPVCSDRIKHMRRESNPTKSNRTIHPTQR